MPFQILDFRRILVPPATPRNDGIQVLWVSAVGMYENDRYTN